MFGWNPVQLIVPLLPGLNVVADTVQLAGVAA
jgi:hypothetical protein